MTTTDKKFIADLKEGKRGALELFYDRLTAASSDEAFWAYLTSIVPGRAKETAVLRHGLVLRGFDRFVEQATPQVLSAFLLAAMSFASCGNGGMDPAPMVVPAHREQAPIVNDSVAAAPDKIHESSAEAPEVRLPTPPTAEELKSNLRDYIRKAQLPAAEKRRMLDTADRATRNKIVDAEADLAALFLKSDPKEIADALEAMVLLKRTERKWLPAMGRLYKGADFS